MVKFKCKHTGNIYTYTDDMDIKTMREHEEYEELIEIKEVKQSLKKSKNVSENTDNKE